MCQLAKTYVQTLALVAAIFVLASPASNAYANDDISLQAGNFFSVYAPGSCRRIDQTGFALHLDCTFHDKQAQFYLKEYPGQLDTQFDSRKNPPPKTGDAINEYRLAALRAVLVGLTPQITIQRIKFFIYGNMGVIHATTSHFWQEGYLSKMSDSESAPRAEKRVLFRGQSYLQGGQTAVLIAFSDLDGITLNYPDRCLGVPDEVSTIITSLAGNSEDGRSWQLLEPYLLKHYSH